MSSPQKGAEAMKNLRERFEDCYTAVPNGSGFKMKYIYYAPWYVWDMPEKSLRRQKCAMLLCSIAGLCISLLSAVQRSALNTAPVAFLLFALALCCHVMEFRGLFQFLGARYRTTKMTYEYVNRLLLTAPILRAAFSGALAVMGISAAVTGGMISFAAALGYGLSAASAVWVYRLYSRIPVTIEENDSLERYESEFT